MRLAFLCGVLGMGVGTFRYWTKVWSWADSVFWPHAYYAELANTPGAIPEKDEDGTPALMVVRPSRSSWPRGFTEAYDMNAQRMTAEQWERAKPANPKMKSELVLVTSETDWWMPALSRLRTHPPDTTVWFVIFKKGAEVEPTFLWYLRFLALVGIPLGGFIAACGSILGLAWVVDGFKSVPKA